MARPKTSTSRSGKSTRSATPQQNKLSFSSRITKPVKGTSGVTKKDASAAQAKALKLEEELSEATDVSAPPSADTSLVESEDVREEPSEQEGTDQVKEKIWGQGDLAIRQQQLVGRGEKVGSGVGAKKDEVEKEARKIGDAQVRRYWKGIDEKRTAPRVHQTGLSLHEKILRHFDMSSQYGPCIGIPRTRRWRRAHRLGLNPPIEVLTVLLKEDSEGTKPKTQRAFVDELVNARLGITAGGD